MQIAADAGVESLRDEIRYAIVVVDHVLREHDIDDAILTHGASGQHIPHSLHYKNRAIDIDWSPWGAPPREIDSVAESVRLILGDDYDVVPEETHLHVEHDPK